jgi:hypothetical protein
MMTMSEGGGGSVREGADKPAPALNQLQPTYVRCPEPWAADCPADQGRNVAEYLAVLPSRDARVIASARVESSVLDLAGPED